MLDIKDMSHENNMIMKMINNYIDNSAHITLKKISEFLIMNDYILSIDLINQLLDKNMIFNSLIEKTFKKYEKEIIDGNLYRLFDDSFVISSLELYCTKNNIEIKSVNDIEDIKDNYDIKNVLGIYFNEISQIPILKRLLLYLMKT